MIKRFLCPSSEKFRCVLLTRILPNKAERIASGFTIDPFIFCPVALASN